MRLATALFAGALAVHAAYLVALRRGFRQAQAPAPGPAGSPLPPRPASVIIAARNEADRLGPLPDALARQTHPALEIVAVDDHSTDATHALLAAWVARDARVRALASAQPPGKKGALTTGIASARFDVLLRTDADTAPDPAWAEALSAHLDPATATVALGMVRLRPASGLFAHVVRHEWLVTGWLMAAAAGLGRPYMAMGASLGHTRRAWEAAGGFTAHATLRTGDDDLFVQAAHRAGARVVVALDAQVTTDAPATVRAWLHQKRRHLADGRHYPPAIQAHLALFHGSGHVLWLAPFVLGAPGAALLALRLALTAWALAPAGRALGEPRALLALPARELGFALMQTLLPALSLRPLRRW